jgi:hypothetical protein
VDLGAVPALYQLLVGLTYMLGGLVFGVATLRAAVLPRPAAALLAIAAALTPAAVLFPHHIQRFAAIPVALALAWLGYTLWSERREAAVAARPAAGSARLSQVAAVQ